MGSGWNQEQRLSRCIRDRACRRRTQSVTQICRAHRQAQVSTLRSRAALCLVKKSRLSPDEDELHVVEIRKRKFATFVVVGYKGPFETEHQ